MAKTQTSSPEAIVGDGGERHQPAPTPAAQPMLEAGTGAVDISGDAEAWLDPAATRQRDREPKVRRLA